MVTSRACCNDVKHVLASMDQRLDFLMALVDALPAKLARMLDGRVDPSGSNLALGNVNAFAETLLHFAQGTSGLLQPVEESATDSPVNEIVGPELDVSTRSAPIVVNPPSPPIEPICPSHDPQPPLAIDSDLAHVLHNMRTCPSPPQPPPLSGRVAGPLQPTKKSPIRNLSPKQIHDVAVSKPTNSATHKYPGTRASKALMHARSSTSLLPPSPLQDICPPSSPAANHGKDNFAANHNEIESSPSPPNAPRLSAIDIAHMEETRPCDAMNSNGQIDDSTTQVPCGEPMLRDGSSIVGNSTDVNPANDMATRPIVEPIQACPAVESAVLLTESSLYISPDESVRRDTPCVITTNNPNTSLDTPDWNNHDNLPNNATNDAHMMCVVATTNKRRRVSDPTMSSSPWRPPPVSPIIATQFPWSDGSRRRAPEGWQCPDVTCRSMWRFWFHGDSVHQIGPFRFLKANDVSDGQSRHLLARCRAVMDPLIKTAMMHDVLTDSLEHLARVPTPDLLAVFDRAFDILLGKTPDGGLLTRHGFTHIHPDEVACYMCSTVYEMMATKGKKGGNNNGQLPRPAVVEARLGP
ncbi:Aste57867_12120 [Aphanomyces stellatus]|uniref:Aste57867_12120 protein n=1 Tax=Aphanomyces stellatus TaxID=120398 RepID=A0A485KUR6_9STRA|nr:hypothetical protein As57867_012075 [Aphanomyces stellatus]VFT88974.1 Aste57867_12120 [Aphanomyces stellatus]